jgi:hypothetical protein
MFIKVMDFRHHGEITFKKPIVDQSGSIIQWIAIDGNRPFDE